MAAGKRGQVRFHPPHQKNLLLAVLVTGPTGLTPMGEMESKLPRYFALPLTLSLVPLSHPLCLSYSFALLCSVITDRKGFSEQMTDGSAALLAVIFTVWFRTVSLC